MSDPKFPGDAPDVVPNIVPDVAPNVAPDGASDATDRPRASVAPSVPPPIPPYPPAPVSAPTAATDSSAAPLFPDSTALLFPDLDTGSAEYPVPVATQIAPAPAVAPSPKRATPTGQRATNRIRHSIPVRIFATFALTAAVTTYVATEVDLVRRHFPGVDPVKYWLPQLQQITLPGLGATAVCALLALAIYKLQRRRT